MANYMQKVAEMLGVDLGEEFEVTYPENTHMILKEDGLHGDSIYTNYDADYILRCLLTGESAVKIKSGFPKYHDTYFFVNETGKVGDEVWVDDDIDIMRYKLGNCYKTRTEAEVNVDKWRSFYLSDEVLEV